MEEKTLTKITENEIIANIRHKNLTAWEMAHLIDEYLTTQLKHGVKLVEIEKKLGITKRVLYKYKSLLKIPKEVAEKYQDKLSFEQMSVISYSVKDKSKLGEVLEEALEKDIPSNRLVYKVAEINDKTKIAKHIIYEIQKQVVWAIGLQSRIASLPSEDQKSIREEVETLIDKLNGV